MSGSRIIRFIGALTPGRVPDGRGVGPFLNTRRHVLGTLDAEDLGVVRRPARRRDLEHAHVVKRSLGSVELRIAPVAPSTASPMAFV